MKHRLKFIIKHTETIKLITEKNKYIIMGTKQNLKHRKYIIVKLKRGICFSDKLKNLPNTMSICRTTCKTWTP